MSELNPATITCDQKSCGREYTCFYRYAVHKYNTHNIRDDRDKDALPCPYGCDHLFTGDRMMRSLLYHYDVQHCGISFQCSACEAPFKHKHYISSHRTKSPKCVNADALPVRMGAVKAKGVEKVPVVRTAAQKSSINKSATPVKTRRTRSSVDSNVPPAKKVKILPSSTIVSQPSTSAATPDFNQLLMALGPNSGIYTLIYTQKQAYQPYQPQGQLKY